MVPIGLGPQGFGGLVNIDLGSGNGTKELGTEATCVLFFNFGKRMLCFSEMIE